MSERRFIWLLVLICIIAVAAFVIAVVTGFMDISDQSVVPTGKCC